MVENLGNPFLKDASCDKIEMSRIEKGWRTCRRRPRLSRIYAVRQVLFDDRASRIIGGGGVLLHSADSRHVDAYRGIQKYTRAAI